MAIQFNCTKCGRLLQVPEGSEGQQAQCQACGNAMTIPAASAAVALTGGENPYTAPANETLRWKPGPGYHEPVSTTATISIGAVIARASAIYRARFFRLLLTQVVIMLGVMAGVFTVLLLSQLFWFAGGGVIVILLTMLLIPFVVMFVIMGLFLGQIRYLLKLARGEAASLADLFSAFGSVPVYFIATFLFWLATSLGYLFCIVPGVYLALTFGYYVFVVVDRREGPITSLETASRLARGNRWAILALYFFVGLGFVMIGGVGAALDPDRNEDLVATVVGLIFLVVWPYALLVHVVSYLMMSNQRVIDPAADNLAPIEHN